MVSVYVIFWAFLFLLWSSFLYFGGVLNKTIIPLALVGYEVVICGYRVVLDRKEYRTDLQSCDIRG